MEGSRRHHRRCPLGVVLLGSEEKDIGDSAAGVKSASISTYTDLVVPICEQSASMLISSEYIGPIALSGLCDNASRLNMVAVGILTPHLPPPLPPPPLSPY